MAQRSMARDAGLVMGLILVSRLLGFVRERAIAEVFGMNVGTDILRAAFVIPDLMYFLVVAGALNAAFMPVFIDHLARGDEREAWDMAGTFFTASVLFLALFATAGMAFTESLAPLVAYSFTGPTQEAFVDLMRLMFPAVFFTALAGLAMGVHKSFKNFGPPMYGPIVYNLAIIAGAYALGPRMGLAGVAAGTIAGAAANFLIQLPFVLRKGWRKLRPRLDFSHPGIRRAVSLMGPAMLGLAAFQINFAISVNLASGLPEGSISALQVANRLLQFPHGVFAMGISTVILPTLAGLKAGGEADAFRRTVSEGLRVVFFVTLPSAAGLAVLGEPITRLLFEVGAFSAQDTRMTAYALSFYAVGLLAQSGNQILLQVYYSLQQTKAIVRVSAWAIAINLAVSLLFLHFTSLAHGGLALAWSLTATATMLHFLFRLRRQIGGLDGRRLGSSLLRSGAASVLTAAVAWSVSSLLGAWVSLEAMSGRFIQVAGAVLAGAAVYLAAARLLRMDELRFLLEAVRRRRRRAAA